MKILFIYSLYNIATLRKPLRSAEAMQFGISYISACLKEHGHNTDLMVLSRISGKRNKPLIKEYINKFRPDVVVFTAVSTEYDFIVSIAKQIKAYSPKAYLIVGGPHVSLNPEGVLDCFDALCIGEGEYPVLELVSQLEKGKSPTQIPNLWIKQEGKIEKNSTRQFLQELDKLPFPDRGMWAKWIDEKPEARYVVLAGRGCPFECTYCCNHALKMLAVGAYVRYRSPENILKEIKDMVEKFPEKKEVYLEVESIGVNKVWLVELCDKLMNFNKTLKIPLVFGANLRITPNMDLNFIFGELKKSNFKFINIGLESGSERVRREILNRNYSNEDIVNAVKMAREYGLKVSFLNMIGIPGETIADFQETVEMNRKCLPDWVGYSIFYPYPGTKIYSLCQAQGLLDKPLPTDMERGKAVFGLKGFSKRQIENCYVWFEYNIYKGRRLLIKLLVKVISLKIRTKPYFFYPYRLIKSLFILK